MTQTARTEESVITRAHRSPAVLAAFVVFGVGMVLRTVFAFWHPGLDELTYQHLSPMHQEWWAFHVFLGAPGAILTFVAFPVLVYSLCRRRGAVLAAIGGVLTVVGTTFFGQGIASEGVAYGYVLNPAALPAELGEAMFGYISDHAQLSQISIFGGLAVTTVGALVLLVALWVARAVPRWLVVLPTVGVVGSLVLPVPQFSLWSVLFDLVTQTVPLVGIALLALRPARTGA